MDAGTRKFVSERAAERCEYYRLHQNHCGLLHHVEHIVARQHGGSDDWANLALACHRCNLHKGPKLSGTDPSTGMVALLFHPRRDRWAAHFAFRGAFLDGLTPAGRATVEVLSLNDARRVELRRELMAAGELS